jgi:tyrosyl-tRNA synthetase
MDNPEDQICNDPRYRVIKSIGEVTTDEDLVSLLKIGKIPVCYNGFEPSGRMTFAQCMIAIVNVKKLTKCGFHFKFWVADWFAKLNHKLGGDLKKIRKAGELMIEIWKAAGMDMSRVEILWASEEILREPQRYWEIFMDICTKFSIQRALKGTPALGREESTELSMSTVVYAMMQCCDIFFLNVDVCQMGSDQVKVNMLAREYAAKTGRKIPPVIISHRLIGGLDGVEKMSKSSPETAIFMDDDPSEVNRKIKKAFCVEWKPEGPVFDILKYIIMELGPLDVAKKDFNGGTVNVRYENYQQLEQDVLARGLHPSDLKPAVAARINELLKPVHEHFERNQHAAALLRTVRGYKTTK